MFVSIVFLIFFYFFRTSITSAFITTNQDQKKEIKQRVFISVEGSESGVAPANAQNLKDDHSLRFYRKIADLVPEEQIKKARYLSNFIYTFWIIIKNIFNNAFCIIHTKISFFYFF